MILLYLNMCIYIILAEKKKIKIRRVENAVELGMLKSCLSLLLF